MIAFLADENFDRNVVRGLLRRAEVDVLIAARTTQSCSAGRPSTAVSF